MSSSSRLAYVVQGLIYFVLKLVLSCFIVLTFIAGQGSIALLHIVGQALGPERGHVIGPVMVVAFLLASIVTPIAVVVFINLRIFENHWLARWISFPVALLVIIASMELFEVIINYLHQSAPFPVQLRNAMLYPSLLIAGSVYLKFSRDISL